MAKNSRKIYEILAECKICKELFSLHNTFCPSCGTTECGNRKRVPFKEKLGRLIFFADERS
jgi:rRNA maturation endonuclease Nob1